LPEKEEAPQLEGAEHQIDRERWKVVSSAMIIL
jgi:hypothetical protein